MIQGVDSNKQGLVKKIYDAEQDHIFRYWDELDPTQRNNLLTQLEEVDFDLLTTLNSDLIHGSKKNGLAGNLEPAEFIKLPKTQDEEVRFEKAKTAGEEALRAGRVAAFLVAGGQGSRLGFDGAKGKFPISPVKNKTLFQLHAEKILASSKKYGVTIPWYIMTSLLNHAETETFFKENDFFGLNSSDVVFFTQAMIPALDPDGKLVMDARDNIFRNPNGHGGSLAALKTSGALDDMKRRGIDLISYFQVDNVLIKICDPVFIGFHVLQEAEMSAKIVVKTDPAEKVGVVGFMDGELGVIEYSDLSEADETARNGDGSLKFQAGSIAIHIFNAEFVERETDGGLNLPWHLAHKKIPYLNENGELVNPESPNAYKFETFVFDALGHAKSTVILEVDRREEFSPVKNAEGSDSPDTARKDMVAQYKRWLQHAGHDLTKGGNHAKLEISPLFANDPDELQEKLSGDKNLGDYWG